MVSNREVKVTGDSVSLDIARNGLVTYRRQANPTAGERPTVVSTQWMLPVAEAAALLDALVAAGVLAFDDTGGGRFPNHAITAHAGRWHTLYHPRELPEDMFKYLRPLLEKADAAFWKPQRRSGARRNEIAAGTCMKMS